jgi:ABC-2 type transport system ATP-binding protein
MTIPPDASAVPILALSGVVKRYGKFTAVRGIDLEVQRGEIFGFLGPNGAGKTTTIRMIAGVLQPSAGILSVGGIDLHRSPEMAKRRIGYIPDRPFLYEKLSGAEFLHFVAALWGCQGAEVDRRIDAFLDLFALSDWRDELIENYSHGMRQKLLISSAFIHEPDLIVVDEPMVGLDPRSARILKDLFQSFVEKGGSIFLSTHTLEVAEALCHRIAILTGGRILAAGTLAELQTQTGAPGASLEEIFLKLTRSTGGALPE